MRGIPRKEIFFCEVRMQNPCELCKKKDRCESKCFPKKDYDRAIRKKRKRKNKC